MKDFFAFRLMITAGLIKVIYPLGIIGIFALVGAGLFIVPKQGSSSPVMNSSLPWDKAVLILLFGNIAWRIFCEQLILLFSIHESLHRTADTKR